MTMQAYDFTVKAILAAGIAASVGAIGLCVYANSCLRLAHGTYFWSIDGNSEGGCSLGGFECEEIPNTPDCVLKFRICSESSLIAGWSIWCLDNGEILKVMFEQDSFGNTPTCSRWDESSNEWVYEYKIPNGNLRDIIVSDGRCDLQVKKKGR